MKRNQSFSFSDFSKLPKKQKEACYMLLCCTLAFLIVVIASSILIFGGQKAEDGSGSLSTAPAESDYNKDAESIDTDQYEDIILPKTPDAGQKYLDDTLFVGDSNTVRMHLYDLVPLANYVGVEGMGIEGVTTVQCVYFQNDTTVYPIPRAISKIQPRRIVMSVGTNNADGSMSPPSFIKSYKAAIAAIQKEYPYCDIIIAAIPPVAQQREYPTIKMKNIDEMNKLLVEMAKELDFPFLNTSEVLKASNGFAKTEYFYEDGLHYSAAGVKAVLNYVRTHAYETQDRRPAVKNVPARQEPPKPEPSSVESAATSVSSSSATSAVSSSSSSSSASSSAAPPSSSAPPVSSSSAPPASSSAPPAPSSAPPAPSSAPPASSAESQQDASPAA